MKAKKEDELCASTITYLLIFNPIGRKPVVQEFERILALSTAEAAG